ncbi:hypothetical protein NQZ79_g3517 [Umbelopsis isabellina]|nr:hypothetical protein NQZ79_g3517 [Umbelopsis isabellina]
MSDSESDFNASASDSDGYVEQQPSTPKVSVHNGGMQFDLPRVNEYQPKKAVKKKPAPKKAEKNSNAEPMSGISTPNEGDSTPSTPSMTSGTATPKTKTIEEIYKRKSQLEHILLRPDTYIGSVEEEKKEMWIFENEKIVKKEISFVPGLYKIIDEILVNAADNKASATHLEYYDFMCAMSKT